MKKILIHFVLIAAIVLVVAMAAMAQEESGWGFSGRVQGSSNAAGVVLRADPSVGYTFNEHVRMYAGLPFYFVNPSDTVGTTTPVGSTGFTNGLGNAYAAMRFAANHPAADFSSTVLVTAPTGDKDKGFSTGRVTADWTNTFSHKFSAVTPFGSAGIANTVSDTSFFARPFTSVGFVSHFDGGATFRLTDFAEAGASAYAVRGSGQQTLFSKGRKGQNSGGTGGLPAGSEIVGSAELANDHGFSTWVSVPKSSADFQIGYTRSVNYDLNTLFFGVGFRIGK